MMAKKPQPCLLKHDERSLSEIKALLCRWIDEDELETSALPTVMRRALLVYTEGGTKSGKKKGKPAVGVVDKAGRKQTGIGSFFTSS